MANLKLKRSACLSAKPLFIHNLKTKKMELKTIQQLEAERLEWSLKNFPDATPRSSMIKLQAEIKEVLKEIKTLEKFPDGDDGLEGLPMEYADCLMCLFDSAGRAGLSVDDIFESFSEKLEINKERTWIKNPDNTYSHVKIKF